MKVLATVVVAVLGVATAYFGYLAVQRGSEVKEVSAGALVVSSSAAVAQTQNAAELREAQSAIAELESQNLSLSSQLAAATAAPRGPVQTSQPAAPTSAASTAGALRHQGPITIAERGETVDLDAPATDPKWGASLDGNGIGSSLYVDNIAQIVTNADFVLVGDGETANYATCAAKTGWAKSFYQDASAITDTAKYCLRTSSGRYATLRKLDQTDNTVTLEITVWEPA